MSKEELEARQNVLQGKLTKYEQVRDGIFTIDKRFLRLDPSAPLDEYSARLDRLTLIQDRLVTDYIPKTARELDAVRRDIEAVKATTDLVILKARLQRIEERSARGIQVPAELLIPLTEGIARLEAIITQRAVQEGDTVEIRVSQPGQDDQTLRVHHIGTPEEWRIYLPEEWVEPIDLPTGIESGVPSAADGQPNPLVDDSEPTPEVRQSFEVTFPNGKVIRTTDEEKFKILNELSKTKEGEAIGQQVVIHAIGREFSYENADYVRSQINSYGPELTEIDYRAVYTWYRQDPDPSRRHLYHVEELIPESKRTFESAPHLTEGEKVLKALNDFLVSPNMPAEQLTTLMGERLQRLNLPLTILEAGSQMLESVREIHRQLVNPESILTQEELRFWEMLKIISGKQDDLAARAFLEEKLKDWFKKFRSSGEALYSTTLSGTERASDPPTVSGQDSKERKRTPSPGLLGVSRAERSALREIEYPEGQVYVTNGVLKVSCARELVKAYNNRRELEEMGKEVYGKDAERPGDKFLAQLGLIRKDSNFVRMEFDVIEHRRDESKRSAVIAVTLIRVKTDSKGESNSPIRVAAPADRPERPVTPPEITVHVGARVSEALEVSKLPTQRDADVLAVHILNRNYQDNKISDEFRIGVELPQDFIDHCKQVQDDLSSDDRRELTTENADFRGEVELALDKFDNLLKARLGANGAHLAGSLKVIAEDMEHLDEFDPGKFVQFLREDPENLSEEVKVWMVKQAVLSGKLYTPEQWTKLHRMVGLLDRVSQELLIEEAYIVPEDIESPVVNEHEETARDLNEKLKKIRLPSLVNRGQITNLTRTSTHFHVIKQAELQTYEENGWIVSKGQSGAGYSTFDREAFLLAVFLKENKGISTPDEEVELIKIAIRKVLSQESEEK